MMSAGQQRRVSLARLKLANASLLVLDEPFTALDKRGVQELEAMLAGFVAEVGHCCSLPIIHCSWNVRSR